MPLAIASSVLDRVDRSPACSGDQSCDLEVEDHGVAGGARDRGRGVDVGLAGQAVVRDEFVDAS